MIVHNEINVGIGALAAGVIYFLGWWSRGPRSKSLDKAFDRDHDQRAEDEPAIFADNYSPPREHRWDDEAGRWICPDRTGPGRTIAEEQLAKHEESYRDGEIYSAEARGEPDPRFRTIYPELAALGAETDGEPPEPAPARLDETNAQWAARMAVEAAAWCAENGIDAGSASGIPL